MTWSIILSRKFRTEETINNASSLGESTRSDYQEIGYLERMEPLDTIVKN